MAEDLAQLHTLAGDLLTSIEGPARGRLLRRLAGDMRRVGQKRMAAQMAPDGTPWPKRKPRRAPRPATRPVRFIYNSSGVERLVDMRSWVKQGDRMTGYDREAEGIRTFVEDRIVKRLPGKGSAESGAAGQRKSGGRRLAMFRGLRTNKHYRAGASNNEAWTEFTDRAARLARIHHYGLKDRVAPGGPEVDYEARELQGFSREDETMILQRFIDNALEAIG